MSAGGNPGSGWLRRSDLTSLSLVSYLKMGSKILMHWKAREGK